MSATATLPPISLETLLAERAWATRLARALVHDEAAAEDLVQDGWLAALHARPSGDRPIRSWLRRVLRNRASNQAREQRRREAREGAVGAALVSDTGSQSPEDLVERLRLQRLLADLVMALDEPHRQTLLLRYYEGLSGADIARRLAAPEGTVRRRLKEALDRLRAELGDWERNNRRSWRALLAPLAAAELSARGRATPAAMTSRTVLSAPMISAFVFTIVAAVAASYLVRGRLDTARADSAGGQANRKGAIGANSSGASSEPARGPERPLPRFRAASPVSSAERRAIGSNISPAQAEVTGNLDAWIIGRVIIHHINEVKWCYERELAANPGLEGRVKVQFTISATGSVVDSALENSTLGSPPVENCLSMAVRRWEFPKPEGGGTVSVSYPFVLTPGTAVEGTSASAKSGLSRPIVATDSSAADRDIVAREVRAGLPAMKACYERRLRSVRLPGGQVSAFWTISQAGRVTAVHITGNSVYDREVEECAKDVISSWRFPALERGRVSVECWFKFDTDPVRVTPWFAD